ncbi:SOS response-associated peptidase [Arthrobacter hankyongi]|nr:SOS response-associated peptidase [Arthrobacter hankyongi]
MCGRFVMARATADLVSAFGVDDVAGPEVRPSWNIAPTQRVRLVTERLDPETGELTRLLETARWGLVPVWAKSASVGARMINARVETVTEKPSFRAAAVKRRALVPAEGYYEWQKTGAGKIPHYLTSEDGSLLAFAGLYEFWKDPELPEEAEEQWLMSCTIITTSATDALGHIHDRTPLIVPPDLQADWLDPHLADKHDVRQLLDAMPEPRLVPRIVSAAVGSVRNNGPELIEPAG